MSEILNRFNELEKLAKQAVAEQPALEAERAYIKRDVSKKIAELKEMGITFESREDLDRLYKETEENLVLSLQSLERKLKEYESLKQELNNIENIENSEVY